MDVRKVFPYRSEVGFCDISGFLLSRLQKRDRTFPGIRVFSRIPGKVFVFLVMLSYMPPERSLKATNGR